MKKSTTASKLRYYVAGLLPENTRDFSDKTEALAFYEGIDPKKVVYDKFGSKIHHANMATLWDTSVIPWILIKQNF
jgi:hypothetical protein